MEHTTPYRCGNGDRVILLGITGLMLAMTWFVHTPAEVSIVDDWTYAWSVEHFLHTGELRMLEWSAHYPLAQILWGFSSANCSGSPSSFCGCPPWC